MQIGTMLEGLGVRLDGVASIALATEGFKAGRDKVLMLALRKGGEGVHRMVAGGDVGATHHITNMTPDVYMKEAAGAAEAVDGVLAWLAEKGAVHLASHGATRFARPFLLALDRRMGNLEYLDTLLLSQIYLHRRYRCGERMKTLAEFMAENGKLSFPREPSTSLDAMLEHFGIDAPCPDCPYTPQAKAAQTAVLLERLWKEDV